MHSLYGCRVLKSKSATVVSWARDVFLVASSGEIQLWNGGAQREIVRRFSSDVACPISVSWSPSQDSFLLLDVDGTCHLFSVKMEPATCSLTFRLPPWLEDVPAVTCEPTIVQCGVIPLLGSVCCMSNTSQGLLLSLNSKYEIALWSWKRRSILRTVTFLSSTSFCSNLSSDDDAAVVIECALCNVVACAVDRGRK